MSSTDHISYRKELVLLDVRGAERAVIFRAAESRGNMVFKFVDASVNIPVLMQNLKDPVPKVKILNNNNNNKRLEYY